jgi:PPOX class probable F420-dependent enzyme
MSLIPDDVAGLLDRGVFVHLATSNPDGSPQVSAIWVDRDGDRILFGTAEGRIKARNLRRDPRVAMSFTAPEDPYRNITIRGRVVAIDANGPGLIDRMAQKYQGMERFDGINPADTRLDVTVEVERVRG